VTATVASGLATAALEAARSIGATIVGSAVWHGGRCNWVGAEPEERPPGSGVVYPSYVALRGDLYGGTAGIGLFLAELAAAADEPQATRTAVGAFRHAFARVRELPPSIRLSLYTGRVGVGLAAARAADVLGDEELRERAARIVAVPRSWWCESDEFDLIGGAAGSAVGLLALADALDRPSLADHAALLGDALIERARKSDRGWSWPSPTTPREHDLAGLSHGAAGVGFALLELWNATGEQRYRDGADEAFRYERSWFDEESRNWPDLRESRGVAPALSYATLWCHGAPGIALSRLRAYELTGDATLQREAQVAVATTQREVDLWRVVGANYSLCHGLAGNAEILLDARAAFGPQLAASERVAHAAAWDGIERYARPGAEWPCGAGEGVTPSLFLGLAGIARFYLRLQDPSLPSFLLVRREQFARPVPVRVFGAVQSRPATGRVDTSRDIE
jgi:lantibiotic modifying enzyme